MNELIKRLRAMYGDLQIAKPLDAIGLIHDAADALAAADERVEELEAELDAARVIHDSSMRLNYYACEEWNASVSKLEAERDAMAERLHDAIFENSRKAKRIEELEALVDHGSGNSKPTSECSP